MSREDKALLVPVEVAKYLNVSLSTLNHWRSERRGPPYVRVEGRLIRYRLADVEKYVAAHSVEQSILGSRTPRHEPR
jgi:excisionase family DNA binding protein